VDLHHHVRLGRAGDVARLARFLAGEAIALVLAGGAARGAPHAGVLRALEERDVPIDLVCGTSVGAVAAGLVGMGLSSTEVADRLKSEIFRRWLFDLHVPSMSVFAGQRLNKCLDRLYGEQMVEDLWQPMFSVSCSLTHARPVVHRRGLLKDVVQRSGAVPGVVPPVHDGDQFLVDGMMLANLPTDQVDDVARCRKIAVNLVPAVDETLMTESSPSRSGLRNLVDRYNPLSKKKPPTIMELGMRAFLLGSVQQASRAANEVACFIEPPVADVGFFDLLAFDRVVELGYESTITALDSWRERDDYPGAR